MRNTHPNLWLGVMFFGLWGLLTGLNVLFLSPGFPDGDYSTLIGLAYVTFGAMKLISGNTDNIDVAKAGMIGCMALSVGVSIFALFSGSTQAALNFFFLGVLQMSAIQEPKVNPLTMKTKKDGN